MAFSFNSSTSSTSVRTKAKKQRDSFTYYHAAAGADNSNKPADGPGGGQVRRRPSIVIQDTDSEDSTFENVLDENQAARDELCVRVRVCVC